MSSAVDDVFESWEEMDESEALDKKLNSLQVDALGELEDADIQNMSTNSSNTKMIILGDESMRSHYVPPKPTVKILKRPDRNTQGSGDGPLLNGDKPKQIIKSLQQREQEYAEARKRILGEELSPEEKIIQGINKIQIKTTILPGTCSVLPSNILRSPTGPDGTRGFNVRR